MNRKKAAIQTALTGIALSSASLFLGFITQKLFIDKLGVEYSGINGILTSILGILTMSDVGISTAVILNLYQPLAENNEKKVASLMQFYHKACIVIGCFILFGSFIILPFIPRIIGQTTVSENLYVVFSLFSITSVFSYFLNYRRPLLAADQKAYLTNRVAIATNLLTFLVKILILLTLSNYYLFLLSTIVFKVIENIIISKIVDKKYPYIHKRARLDKKIALDIKKKVLASLFHNTGYYVVFSTDNLVLSFFFGVATTGLYANYAMVINGLKGLLSQIFSGVSAGFGNILAKEGKEYLYISLKRVMFLNTWIYSIVTIALYFCFESFIKIWLGDDFLFDDLTVFALCFNFYLTGIRLPVESILNAGRIVYENRFMPIIESIINIVTSILLAKLIGIPGVFIGTIASNLFLHLYSYSKYAYKTVLGKSRLAYIIDFLKHIFIFGLGFFVQFLFSLLFKFTNPILELFIYGASSIILPSLLYTILFFRSDNFSYYMKMFFKKKKTINNKQS